MHAQVIVEAKHIQVIPHLLEPTLQDDLAGIYDFAGQMTVQSGILIGVFEPLLKSPEPGVDEKRRSGVGGFSQDDLSCVVKAAGLLRLSTVVCRVVGIGPEGVVFNIRDVLRIPERCQVMGKNPVAPNIPHEKSPHGVLDGAVLHFAAGRRAQDQQFHIAVQPLLYLGLQVDGAKIANSPGGGRDPQFVTEGVVVTGHNAAVGAPPKDRDSLRFLVTYCPPEIFPGRHPCHRVFLVGV